MRLTFLSLAACLAAYGLAACKPAKTDEAITPSLDITKGEEVDIAIKDGAVRLRLMTPVAEPFACIIPIRVENGLDSNTNVTMIGFSVTGPGEDARGNMFAPIAEAGEMSEARVIIEGQSCGAFDTLSIPEIRCTSGQEACEEQIELIDGGGLRFSKAG